MSRRIEIELTSHRDEATFTWRAAGARQPKGEVAVATLPEGASVGDTFKVEIETGLDGHEVIGVIPERIRSRGPERLELLGREVPDDALVTSQLATRSRNRKGPGRRRDRDGGRDRRGRAEGRGRGENRGRTGDRRDAGSAPRERAGSRPGRTVDQDRSRTRKRAPRAPRLRPGRAHRNAFIDTLSEEQRPVADQLLRGGMPNLRQAIAKDNEQRRAQGQPEVPGDRLIEIGEAILPRLLDAEWQDRAEAALEQIDTVDLRDLRSVVVAATDHARTPETREVADALREQLAARVERAQAEWLTELQSALDDKRIVRVLNLSSRPPKAGAPLPQPLADSMVAATNAALSAESASGRWVALLDALAYSPIRHRVRPSGIPAEPSEELRTKVAKLRSRLPEIAAAFAGPPSAGAPPAASDEPPATSDGTSQS